MTPGAMTFYNPYADTIIKIQEPTLTSMWVRRPAAQTRRSRSAPIRLPSPAAISRRTTNSQWANIGTPFASQVLIFSTNASNDHSRFSNPAAIAGVVLQRGASALVQPVALC